MKYAIYLTVFIVICINSSIALAQSSEIDRVEQLSEKIISVESEVDELRKLVDDLSEAVYSPRPPSDWEKMQVNTVYKAETNGLVSAQSGGEGKVSAGIILEGPKQNLVWGKNARTRFGRYDGSILPVQKGRWWKVQSIGEGDSDTITVYWMPLGFVDGD